MGTLIAARVDGGSGVVLSLRFGCAIVITRVSLSSMLGLC